LEKNNVFLYDNIGNSYKRKNKYLLELNTLNMQMQDADPKGKKILKDQIHKLKKNKNDHPHIIAIGKYKREEKNFLTALNAKTKVFKSELDSSDSIKLKKLRIDLFKAKEKVNFYVNHIQLTYDAELQHEQNRIVVKQLPEIIDLYITTRRELKEARESKQSIDQSKEQLAKKKYAELKQVEQKKFKEGIVKLKDKKKIGLISEKALRNGIIELKAKRKETNTLNSYNIETKSVNELIKNKKYILTKGIKLKINILKSNLSDVRRKTPIETEKTLPLFSFLTVLIPGLGQMLNKQYFKAFLFSLVTVFIYFIAIPYALGYGNYQGDGIAGLLSLAEYGKKIDKSLIFMIEGIVAVFLVLISMALYALSFNDVHKTEKNIIVGIRPRNWFDTVSKIEQEGFPYMVTAPALLVTIFIVLVPITTAILLSFTGMDPQHQSKFGWVGINNYKLIALGQGLAGSVFWSILTWTLIWTAVATSMAIATGFFLAIIANNDRIKGKTFFRVVYLLPWAVPAFITIMFFSIMFSPNGALTTVIYDVFNIQVQVKNDATLSRITLILLQTWLGSSYVFLLSTGVLQAIPGDLYEAAQIDGATSWQKLKRITLPIVLFQTAPLLVGQYTFNFNNFSIIYLFNSGGPFNPSKYGNLAGSTDLLISYIYKLTMENQYQSIGAAITIVISMGLMLFAFVGFKNSKAFKEERL
jgi:arabinogalactan oligomer/maltooligosaccharide transport system permease protein